MKLILLLLFSFLLILLFVVIFFGLLRTLYVQNNGNQKEFLSGRVPKNMPDGFYKGSVGNIKVPWMGKRFNSKKSTGINRFADEKGNTNEKYPFTTYIGEGIQDKGFKVLKIDYGTNRSPWWIKYILDEVVEVKPGNYLGKVHITILPKVPLTLGYFRLTK